MIWIHSCYVSIKKKYWMEDFDLYLETSNLWLGYQHGSSPDSARDQILRQTKPLFAFLSIVYGYVRERGPDAGSGNCRRQLAINWVVQIWVMSQGYCPHAVSSVLAFASARRRGFPMVRFVSYIVADWNCKWGPVERPTWLVQRCFTRVSCLLLCSLSFLPTFASRQQIDPLSLFW